MAQSAKPAPATRILKNLLRGIPVLCKKSRSPAKTTIKLMKNAVEFVVFVLILLTVRNGHSQIALVQSANQAPQDQTFWPVNSTYGWRFTVDEGSSLSLTDLGFFDSGGNGLDDSYRIGIWDSGGNLLADATVPDGVGGTLSGSFRYVSIDPITLNAGESYTLGAWTSGGDDSAVTDLTITGSNSETIASQIDYLGHAYSPGGFQVPGAYSTSGFGNFGPNAIVTAVPEPHEYALIFAAGLLAFALLRKRFAEAPR